MCSALNGSRLRVAVDARVICLSVISFRETTLARQPWRQCSTANLTGTGSVDRSVYGRVCEGVEHGRLVWGGCVVGVWNMGGVCGNVGIWVGSVDHGRFVWAYVEHGRLAWVCVW